MHVTIDPRPVQPVNHCFTTCTGRTSRTSRTSRAKPFTGRISSCILDKDEWLPLRLLSLENSAQVSKKEGHIPAGIQGATLGLQKYILMRIKAKAK